MKKQFFLMGAAAILALAACNDNATDTTAKTDSTVTTNPGDTTIQTTTTTTTTTKTVRPIANFERRTFYNVKTKKPVKLRMDTVLHYYVDVTTNQQPDYYYYDLAAKDTFDYYGRVLNNALINNNGDYTVDETRIVMPADNTSDNTKIKATDNKYKEKTDTSKVKVTDNKMKVKKK